MNSDELRTAFLKFFEEKGHKVIPSSSLVPKGDPTLLLTNAGMVQVKPYFLGEAVPPSLRMASCQKCFRTTDIELVGDATHLTFFEMLGNFSVGDYFKKEAIAWGWEFITERLKIPAERLWATIYLDDDEAFKYWREIGVPEAKIVRFGEEDNFWGPAGSSGPCGPCSEIHYDFGADKGCGKPDCRPNCECGRFTELWNLVFPQYNQDEAGNRTPLPKPSIDTGMGLERLTAVMAGKTSIYDTDIFMPLLDRISWLSRKNYGDNENVDYLMRVVAEHSRGIAFLVADGVIPSNEGRGYVLRRLIRRAGLFGRMLGLGREERPAWPVLEDIIMITIDKMKHVYPEIEQRKEFISSMVFQEGVRFGETLDSGLALLDGIIDRATTKKSDRISAKEAFKLYDTYGFPIELTRDIATRRGLSVDMAGFEAEMEKQRKRARASHKFALPALSLQAILAEELKKIQESMQVALQPALSTPKFQTILAEELKKIQESIQVALQPVLSTQKAITEIYRQLDMSGTEFTGYHTHEQKAKIIRFLVDSKITDVAESGQQAGMVLDTSPFFAEMGGQVGDTGEIVGPSGRFTVTDTVSIQPAVTVHQGRVVEGRFKSGEEVKAVVDIERRRDIARNHTATHLLQAALRQVLGEHIQQRGSLVAPDRLRFDFSHLAAMTPEEIKAVQRIVNDKIRRNLRVYDEETDYKKAVADGAIALFDEKYGDVVRVLRIGEPVVSTELCGGTHVNFTGEIGYFHILSEGSIGAGLRRIEAVTGREAEKYIDQRLNNLNSAAQSLETTPDNVNEKVAELVARIEEDKKRSLSLERELARKEAESLMSRVESIKGINVLSAKVSTANQQVMREMTDFLRDNLKSGIIVLGAVSNNRPVFIAAVTPDLVEKGYSAGDIIKKVSQVTGGGGGGKAGFAQAGGKDKNKLDEALRLVKDLI